MEAETQMDNHSEEESVTCASRQTSEQADAMRGSRAGKAWAKDAAEYDWLRRLADESSLRSQPFETLRAALDPNEEIDPGEVNEICFNEENDISNEYIIGFITGAVEFFEEIRSEL